MAAEIERFHSYVRYKFRETTKTIFSHAGFYRIIVEDSIVCVFPNVEIALTIFLTLMTTNCSTERSFSRMKYIKNPCRTVMRQKRLGSFSLLMIEADKLREIDFDDVIKDFARRKCRKKFFLNEMDIKVFYHPWKV